MKKYFLFLFSSSLCWAGGGGCHYPDIEQYKCIGRTESDQKLVVVISDYQGLGPTSAVKLDDTYLSYKGRTTTTMKNTNTETIYYLSSDLDDSVRIEAHFKELKKVKTYINVEGFIKKIPISIQMPCAYSYFRQC